MMAMSSGVKRTFLDLREVLISPLYHILTGGAYLGGTIPKVKSGPQGARIYPGAQGTLRSVEVW